MTKNTPSTTICISNHKQEHKTIFRKRTYQEGFTGLIAILFVFAIAMVGGIGYSVWHSQRATRDIGMSVIITSPAQPKQSSLLTLDKTKLPDGWTVESDAPFRKTLLDKNGICHAEITQTVNKFLKADRAQAFIKQQRAKFDLIDGDGYKTTISSTTLQVQTSQGQRSIEASSLTQKSTDSDFQTNNRIAFMVGNGYYLDISEGCSGNGIGPGADQFTYTQADQALRAITIKTD